MSNQTHTITQEVVAEKLLWGLWRSISEDYKMKYPRDIWDHFENAIRSASYTSNLKGFLSLFQRRLPLDLQAQYMKGIKEVIDANQDEEILDWLRNESTYMMMIVRINNQKRKESFKASEETEPIEFDMTAFLSQCETSSNSPTVENPTPPQLDLFSSNNSEF